MSINMSTIRRLTVLVPCLLLSVLSSCNAFSEPEPKELPPSKNAEEVLREQGQRFVTHEEIKRDIENDAVPDNILQTRQASASSWWFANIYRNGTVPWGTSGYILWRNVKDYGAVGNGDTNDTAAMQAALDAPGNRCAGQYSTPNPCESSTTLPAIVYVPPGTYIITKPLIMYYNTFFIGDLHSLPKIVAHSTFQGIGLLDPDPYYSGGASWYANQNNMWRQVRNLILDTRQLALSYSGGAIHWQVAQATSLQNVVMYMREGSCAINKQTGIFMDNGSGGFMRDLIINGGGRGFLLGNQQFTGTNMTINNACTAVFANWDWLFLFRNLKINNALIGIDMPLRGKPAIGHILVTDSVFNNVTLGVSTTFNCSGTNKPASVGSLILQNVDFRNSPTAVGYPNGTSILPGRILVDYWMQGNTYSAYYGQQTFPAYGNQTCWIPQAPQICVQGSFPPPPIPASLKASGTSAIFDRGKPNYDDYPLSAFISTKANGCVGDGVADDTDCIQRIMNRVNTSEVMYVDHGAYRITKQITVPNNIKIMGEMWPLLMINDANGIWSNKNNPVPAFIVGKPGDIGNVEIQDILFETMGPTPGAILMQWNLAAQTQGSAGMWDTHWRLGGTAGTELQELTSDESSTHCAKTPNDLVTSANLMQSCYVSFLIFHITSTGNGYFENNWGWVSDHEMDQATHGQISIWNGRGLLVESQDATWVIGGSFEHSMLYNYGVHNAKNLYMGHVQSETAYMQSNPDALAAYTPITGAPWYDPDFSACKLTPTATNCVKTWGLQIHNSEYIFVYGTGMYSFFVNYDSVCLITNTCQQSAILVEQSEGIYVFALYAVGTEAMVMMDQTRLAPQGLNGMSFGSGIILFEFP